MRKLFNLCFVFFSDVIYKSEFTMYLLLYVMHKISLCIKFQNIKETFLQYLKENTVIQNELDTIIY